MNQPNQGGGWASIASPIGGLLQSWIGSRTSKKNTERTIQANKELAEYQYQKDLEMWNRQNEYNSPAAQMARLKEAGLNPNLVYGSGSAAGNVSSQLPKYNAPQVDYRGVPPPVDIPQMIQMYQDFRLRKAQTDNIQAQTDLTNVKTAIETGIGYATREQNLKGKEWDYIVKQYQDPLRSNILQNQMEASKYLQQVAIAKLNNILQQNANLKATEKATQATTRAINLKSLWTEKGITPSDNIALRFLAQMLGLDQIKSVGNQLHKYGAPLIQKIKP